MIIQKIMEINNSIVKNVFYNTFGTFFYFFCQWLITVLVVKISGYEDAGILSIIISTSNIFYCLATYGVRNFQVSDVEHNFKDNDYIVFRLITICLSFLLFLFVFNFLEFNQKTKMCLIGYLFYKYGECITDLVFGIFQRYNLYKQIGLSYIFKGLLPLILFIFVLGYTKNLFITIISNIVIYYLIIFIYDLRNLKTVISDISLKASKWKLLAKRCWPLMVYTAMIPYLNFITRLVIEKNYGAEVLGYYSSVTMVLVVMSTLMNSIFISIVPKIAKYYLRQEYVIIWKIIIKITLLLLILLIIGIIGSIVLGDFIFTVIFDEGIIDYMYLLIPTVICSILLTMTTFMSSILIAIKRIKTVLVGNILGMLICTIFVHIVVKFIGIIGTLVTLGLSLSFVCIFLIYSLYNILNRKNERID